MRDDESGLIPFQDETSEVWDDEQADLDYVHYRLSTRHGDVMADTLLDDELTCKRIMRAYTTLDQILKRIPGRSMILYERLWADAAVTTDAVVQINRQSLAHEFHCTEDTIARWIRALCAVGVVERIAGAPAITLRVSVLLQPVTDEGEHNPVS